MSLETVALLAPLLSLGVFFCIEKFWLRRQSRGTKLPATAAIYLINTGVSLSLSLTLLMPLVFLVAPLQIFSFSEWQVPVWISFTASFLFLDFFHYLSHRLHHAIPLLWRLHRLHHSDRNVNVLTTVLHHPLEIVTGFVGVIVSAVMFDVPVIVLTVYSVIFGMHSAFTHLNLVLPPALNHWLKWVVVTPNFHRVHHALDMRDSNSNYGLIFVFWDYLFRTVSQQSRSRMAFGISQDQTPQQDSIGAYLANPLR